MYVERSRNAYLTWSIISINIVFFLIVNLSPGLILYLGAVPIYTIFFKEPHRLLTSMFVHYDPIHLFFNMFALFIFGPEIERVIGKSRYLILYFLSGLTASIFHAYYIYLFFPIRTLLTTPAIGASGAIYGVMAAYGVLFPFRRLVAFVFFPIMAPALVVIIILALIQTLYAFIAPFSQVAYAAHVGGFITGLVITLIYRKGLRRMPIYSYF
ncbi:MAG: rhomboid family intramembrane serine protease [Aigarchaeota archaeon]|nr:rhomboid family intramembrane serine protease [Aigarchaeota archaeon]MCX8193469.1 rhomboid family intramembrane serine protease [Nitrososphaeria archaeon]MDW7985799.1 rhomboid family intramembrane serine protease [Nitrososphaerota archaeon]